MENEDEEFSYASINAEFQEFKKLAMETTANLKRMTAMQEEMRWQFGDPKWWEDFEKEVGDAATGWISSHC